MSGERIAPALRPFISSLSSLRPHPRNPRSHATGLDAIKRSLERFGQQKPVVALKDGTILAGHGLVEAAKALGWKKVAVAKTDMPDGREAEAYMVADNRTAELSAWDLPALSSLLDGIKSLDAGLAEASGFSHGELDAMLKASLAIPPSSVTDEALSRKVNKCPSCGYEW